MTLTKQDLYMLQNLLINVHAVLQGHELIATAMEMNGPVAPSPLSQELISIYDTVSDAIDEMEVTDSLLSVAGGRVIGPVPGTEDPENGGSGSPAPCS